ncbi:MULTISPECIES: sensor histidine kinase [Lysobacter]|uniref:histidine kinase n=1 Tax=Lysobacter firmicutimachus TaxID=1792846 RepID=A0ABU8D8M5_9GAMM|nr:PAS domain S-box protein [Lysobacter antibioticus]
MSLSPAPKPAVPAGDDRFRQAMTASNIGMAIVSLDGIWLEVNPALCALLGYRIDELLGHHYSEVTHPDDLEISRNLVAALVNGSLASVDEHKRYLHRDGREVWVQLNIAVMRDEDGAPQYFISHMRDIGGERAAGLALSARAEANGAALDASQRQLQLFADAVSHDLRAPLRSIESFSALLSERAGERLNETDRDYLGRIRAAASRMTSLLAALNELSHATRTELRREPVDLSLLADWVGAELQDADPSHRAQIQVQPGLQVEGDERLLKLMLTQLLHNAWKFSSQGLEPGAAVRIEVTGAVEDGRLSLAVRDHGSGFDMRYAHKLFEPFQRLHGPDQGGGHGLGLAIAQRIAERHGGRLLAQSQAEAGSTFIVELPVVAAGGEDAHA